MSKKKEEIERPDIIIEGNTALWTLRLDGDINGTYHGTFRFKCYLTPLEQIAADREYRELLGPQPFAAPQHESLLAYSLTQLKYRVISSPPFWNSQNPNAAYSGDIPDENVLAAILDASLASEVKYKKLLKKKKEESIKVAKKSINKLMTETSKEDEDVEDDSI